MTFVTWNLIFFLLGGDAGCDPISFCRGPDKKKEAALVAYYHFTESQKYLGVMSFFLKYQFSMSLHNFVNNLLILHTTHPMTFVEQNVSLMNRH